MSFENKLEELVASGRINGAQAAEMKSSMGIVSVAPAAQRKSIPQGLVLGIASFAIVGTITAMILRTTQDTQDSAALPQNVAEVMNTAGATGAAGPGLASFFAVIVLIILPLTVMMLAYARTYNGLAAADESVNASEAIIKAANDKRANLLPNISAIAESAMGHEKAVQALASGAQSALAPQLAALMENYPQLKADQNLLALQHQMMALEHGIETARIVQAYALQDYNTQLRSVMGGFVGSISGFRAKQADATPTAAPAILQQGDKNA